MTRAYLIGLLYALPILRLSAQGVNNVRAEQFGAEAVIQYDLGGSGEYYVSLSYSTDNGVTFSDQLNKVSGDVGNDVKSGINKRIVWYAENEIETLRGPVIFKVSADLKVVMGEPAFITWGEVGVTKVERLSPERIKIDFYFKSHMEKQIVIYAKDEPSMIVDGDSPLTPESGSFGAKNYGLNSRGSYGVQSIKDVPVYGSLIFEYKGSSEVISSLRVPFKVGATEQVAVVKNILFSE